MTAQEAIDVLEIFTTDEAQRMTSSEFDDAIVMAIKSLEKQSKLERVIERLDRELKIAEKEMEDCTFKGMPFYDTQAGYAKAMYKAIEIIKEELM